MLVVVGGVRVSVSEQEYITFLRQVDKNLAKKLAAVYNAARQLGVNKNSLLVEYGLDEPVLEITVKVAKEEK